MKEAIVQMEELIKQQMITMLSKPLHFGHVSSLSSKIRLLEYLMRERTLGNEEGCINTYMADTKEGPTTLDI